MLWFYIFASPWIIGFSVFMLGPMAVSFYVSLTDWDTFTDPTFIGLGNYQTLMSDPIFLKVVGNTLFYSLISVPVVLAAGLGIATLLSKPIRGRKIFRTILYLPVLVPIVATAMVFKMVLAPSGPLNMVLGWFGIQGPSWLLEAGTVKPALILMALWGAGASIVLFLAAMNSIPIEFYEAAEMDGANGIRQFWSITFPQVTPVILFNLITGMIGAFQVFAQVYVLTSSQHQAPGGPNNSSMMIVPFLYQQAFGFYKMGYASAISWLLFLAIAVLTALTFATSRRWVFYETSAK